MKKLLITGFEPFGGCPENPSSMAVEALPDRVGEWEVHKRYLPTIFGEAANRVLAAAEELHPDRILCVGQAGGRDAITPERIGVNIRDARIPDNAGNQPRGEFVVQEGPAAYFATVPVEAMAQAVRDRHIPASVSNTAGTYVCNDVLYTLLHRYHGTGTQVGFVHVPNTPGLGAPSLPLDRIVEGLTAIIITGG
jgi:pyroglutamyl-peptidase